MARQWVCAATWVRVKFPICARNEHIIHNIVCLRLLQRIMNFFPSTDTGTHSPQAILAQNMQSYSKICALISDDLRRSPRHSNNIIIIRFNYFFFLLIPPEIYTIFLDITHSSALCRRVKLPIYAVPMLLCIYVRIEISEYEASGKLSIFAISLAATTVPMLRGTS